MTALADALIKEARDDEVARYALADLLEEQGRHADAADVRHADQHGENVRVRWMIRLDMPGVLAFCPWNEERLLGALRKKNCIALVAGPPDLDKIYGCAVYAMLKRHLRVLAFCVHPDHHADGTAGQMFLSLKNKLSRQRRRCLKVDTSVGLCQEWWGLHPLTAE